VNVLPPRRISGSAAELPTTLTWSEEIGKRVRTGDWSDQAVSTSRKVRDAIAGGHWELAAQLVDYFMEEAKVCHVIYMVWSDGFDAWLASEGVTGEEVAAETERMARVLAFPDGTPFDPLPRWEALGERAGRLGNLLRGFATTSDSALASFEELRESWRQLHDRWVDRISSQLALIARRFGEDALERCYRFVLEPYLQERYAPFDLRERTWDETLYRNLYLSFESMRGHLCGPERDGDVELTEHEDRWVLRFDPCGSGNRGQRGDLVENTPSRMEEPYGFGVTTGEHDWAWNEKGVCYYCAHCCFALELWPAEQWGHPLRIVDSPLWPEETAGPEPAKCSWTIYKSVDAIPEEAYRRVGKVKPRSGEEG
jgi:hypothetical protein